MKSLNLLLSRGLFFSFFKDKCSLNIYGSFTTLRKVFRYCHLNLFGSVPMLSCQGQWIVLLTVSEMCLRDGGYVQTCQDMLL